MVVLTTSSGCPNVVTSNMLRPAPSSRLLNLTGFFSSVGGGGAVASNDCDIVGKFVELYALTKGEGWRRRLEDYGR